MAKDDFSSILNLPDDFGLGEDLARSEQKLRIRTESRRYGKPVTIIEGFDAAINLKELASTLKKKLGTGGTVEDGTIELQGNHRDRLPALLAAEGFTVLD
uniref:stress response translation initiation inhibitor YciH n=1 Tax=Haladaptatus sp. DJG-WS-42 TaxID=3120516 RepID=UPI00403F8CA0